ncbi:MAG: hypothetical protein GY851_33205 [bacterium]|nr:hypothetical protein [bacterium]
MSDTAPLDIAVDRHRDLTVLRRADLPLDDILRVLDTPGEVMKTSRKSETRRVGGLVVKESRSDAPFSVIKHTLLRHRYRQGWAAALRLASDGVPVASPRAFIERSWFGIITGNVMISDYLEGCLDVEHYADHRIEQGWSGDEIHGYLERLADAVNALLATGAYHTDLAGKNILTRDGITFYFIDLDGIVLDHPYSESTLLKTHIQLYDSFCDRWDDGMLEPFVGRLSVDSAVPGDWFDKVREGQKVRRARTLERRRRRGRG